MKMFNINFVYTELLSFTLRVEKANVIQYSAHLQ